MSNVIFNEVTALKRKSVMSTMSNYTFKRFRIPDKILKMNNLHALHFVKKFKHVQQSDILYNKPNKKSHTLLIKNMCKKGILHKFLKHNFTLLKTIMNRIVTIKYSFNPLLFFLFF